MRRADSRTTMAGTAGPTQQYAQKLPPCAPELAENTSYLLNWRNGWSSTLDYCGRRRVRCIVPCMHSSSVCGCAKSCFLMASTFPIAGQHDVGEECGHRLCVQRKPPREWISSIRGFMPICRGPGRRAFRLVRITSAGWIASRPTRSIRRNEANDFLEAILPYYRTGCTTWPTRTLSAVRVERRGPGIYVELGTAVFKYDFTTDAGRAADCLSKLVEGEHVLHARGSIVARVVARLVAGHGDDAAAAAVEYAAVGRVAVLAMERRSDAVGTQASPVPGIAGNVDRNVFDGTIDELEDLLLGNDGSIPGDYNRDGIVDAADYIVWRKTMGQTVPIYGGADGNGNSRIDSGDYTVWKTNSGRTAGAGLPYAPCPGAFKPSPAPAVRPEFVFQTV